jgi:hypothetical protein
MVTWHGCNKNISAGQHHTQGFSATLAHTQANPSMMIPTGDSDNCFIVPFEHCQKLADACEKICAHGQSDSGVERTRKNRPNLLIQSSLDDRDSLLFSFTPSTLQSDAGTMDRRIYNRQVGAIIHRSALNVLKEHIHGLRHFQNPGRD